MCRVRAKGEANDAMEGRGGGRWGGSEQRGKGVNRSEAQSDLLSLICSVHLRPGSCHHLPATTTTTQACTNATKHAPMYPNTQHAWVRWQRRCSQHSAQQGHGQWSSDLVCNGYNDASRVCLRCVICHTVDRASENAAARAVPGTECKHAAHTAQHKSTKAGMTAAQKRTCVTCTTVPAHVMRALICVL